MNIDGRYGARGGPRVQLRTLSETSAAAYELALKWREECRAEKAAARIADYEQQPHPDGDAKRRVKFAKGIARAEFGRAYWDERLHRSTRKPAGSSASERNHRDQAKVKARGIETRRTHPR